MSWPCGMIADRLSLHVFVVFYFVFTALTRRLMTHTHTQRSIHAIHPSPNGPVVSSVRVLGLFAICRLFVLVFVLVMVGGVSSGAGLSDDGGVASGG